jgi:chromosomal replication initiation ATPase DnaA
MDIDLKDKYTIEEIKELGSEFFGVSINDLCGPSRKARIKYARFMTIYFCRKVDGSTFKGIGKIFGNRHHSTVINAIEKTEDYMALKYEQLEKAKAFKEFLLKPKKTKESITSGYKFTPNGTSR